jgi:hypothetical protein
VAGRPALGVRRRGRIGPEARLLWLAVFVFVAVSVWWLTQDNRIPDFDSGLHMAAANADRVALTSGHLLTPFTSYNTYPPLVHLVGAVAILIAGIHPMALTVASNLVFVPLLAFGCYGVGKIVAGPRAGLLAGLVGLCTPMFVSMMHNFDLDPPEAAMVAVSVWGLLASRRFERLGVSAVAGALCGLALLTKETASVFLVGLLVAIVARGGWRNWRGLLAFGGAFLVVAGPWYIGHAGQLLHTYRTIGQLYVNGVQSPPRWSLRNFGWYFWNLVNEQALLPFTIALVVGLMVAILRCVRDRSPGNVLPELLVGGVVSYLGMTLLTHKDPRYTLPALVYVAVLATFWIVAIPRRALRLAVTGALVAVALVNFVGMCFGPGGTQRVMLALPGARNTIIFPHQLTLYENWGWLRGSPHHDGDVLGLLKGLRRTGFTAIAIDPGANEVDFSFLGIVPVADSVNMNTAATPVPGPHLAYLLLHTPVPGDPPPCQRLNDGSGIYAIQGQFGGISPQLLRNPSNPRQQYTLVCPGRPATAWPALPSA